MSQPLNLDLIDSAAPLGLDAPTDRRRETRKQIVRFVEYAPYPRRTRDERRRVGFSRNTSASGMCISVKTAENPGALLHVVGTDVDGNPSTDTLARVAWCQPRSPDHFQLGLQLISATGAGRMLKVRHTARRQKVAVQS